MRTLKLLSISMLFCYFMADLTYAAQKDFLMPNVLVGTWQANNSNSTYIFENDGAISRKIYVQIVAPEAKTLCFVQVDFKTNMLEEFENAPDTRVTYLFSGLVTQATVLSTVYGDANFCQEFVNNKNKKGSTDFLAITMKSPTEFALGYSPENSLSYDKVQ
jgi:hypothetical protein